MNAEKFGYLLSIRLCKTQDEEKQIFFGPGPEKLLRLIDELGSLHKASQKMNMSYSKAWSIIKELEKMTEISFTQKMIGGTGGGGSTLTKEGRAFLDTYTKFVQEAEQETLRLFRQYFHEEA